MKPKYKSNETGNITFYLAFVMPISLCFLMIVIDISQWQFLREEAQREADRIVLEIASNLPSEDKTRAAFLARANVFNQRSPNLKISLDTANNNPGIQNSLLQAGQIQVSITGQHESILDSLMSTVTGQEVVFPINQTASARIIPYDLMLVFSDAISMRPEAFSTWGNAGVFPESDYFSRISLPTISVRPPPVPPRAWPDWWNPTVFNSTDFKRWSTQLCYNPATLPLKQSALMLVDAISASNQNRIGVYSTPGDLFQGAGFSFIKELSFVNDLNKPVRWSNYFEPDVPNSDEACLLYSHQDLGLSTYPIPNNTSVWNNSTNCPQVVVKNPFQSPIGHYPNPLSSSLSNCYTNGGASVRDAIFYHAVRMHEHQANATNVAQSLRSAVSRLIEEDKIDPTQNKTLRKGLVGSSNKIVVLISDLVPSFNDPQVVEALNGLTGDEKIKIYIFAYNHSQLAQTLKDFNSANINQYLNFNERLFAKQVDETTLPLEIKSLLANEKRVILSS